MRTKSISRQREKQLRLVDKVAEYAPLSFDREDFAGRVDRQSLKFPYGMNKKAVAVEAAGRAIMAGMDG